MKKYKFLGHTADMKFRAFGKNLEEAFSNAALALADTIIDIKKLESVKEKKIRIISEDKKSLLYDFLEKFLYMMDAEHFVIGKVVSLKITKGKKYSLSAVVKGNKGLKNFDFKRHVKAVTYNDMVIDERPKKVMIQVVLDL